MWGDQIRESRPNPLADLVPRGSRAGGLGPGGPSPTSGYGPAGPRFGGTNPPWAHCIHSLSLAFDAKVDTMQWQKGVSRDAPSCSSAMEIVLGGRTHESTLVQAEPDARFID